MKVFRIVLNKYSHELSGKGAAVYGGRWNSAGIEMVYTSEHRSLALCEILVHIVKSKRREEYKMLTIDIPDKYSIGTLAKNKNPENWHLNKSQLLTQAVGDEFIRNEEHLAIGVPSVVIPEELNILINPYHPKFKYVKIKETKILDLDNRFFAR